MASIAVYCRHLEHIDFDLETDMKIPVQEDFLCECLASYENQLEHARIWGATPDNLKKVVESCRNATFDLEFDKTAIADFYRNMDILGKNLTKVSFVGTNFDTPGSESEDCCDEPTPCLVPHAQDRAIASRGFRAVIRCLIARLAGLVTDVPNNAKPTLPESICSKLGRGNSISVAMIPSATVVTGDR